MNPWDLIGWMIVGLGVLLFSFVVVSLIYGAFVTSRDVRRARQKSLERRERLERRNRMGLGGPGE